MSILECNFVNLAKKDTKKFFDKIRKLRQNDTTIMPLSKEDSGLATSVVENAELFNKAFGSVYKNSSGFDGNWSGSDSDTNETTFEQYFYG